MKRALVWVILLAMPARSVASPHSPQPSPRFPAYRQTRRVARRSRFGLHPTFPWGQRQQSTHHGKFLRPPFSGKAQRAAIVKELAGGDAGLGGGKIDKAGNVVGGAARRE